MKLPLATLLAVLLTGSATAGAQTLRDAVFERLVGLWSLDGTCASGFGMKLGADGTAWHDEGGAGMWTVGKPTELILIIVDHEPGTDMAVAGPPRLVRYGLADLASETVTLSSEDGTTLNARRCPE